MKLFFRFVTGDFVRRGPPMECDVVFFSDGKSLKILSVGILATPTKGGALRDDTKNGRGADYWKEPELRSCK